MFAVGDGSFALGVCSILEDERVKPNFKAGHREIEALCHAQHLLAGASGLHVSDGSGCPGIRQGEASEFPSVGLVGQTDWIQEFRSGRTGCPQKRAFQSRASENRCGGPAKLALAQRGANRSAFVCCVCDLCASSEGTIGLLSHVGFELR